MPDEEYDLIVTFAAALRDAHAKGDVDRERRVAATLSQQLHLLQLEIGPEQNVAPALTHRDGHPHPALHAGLLH